MNSKNIQSLMKIWLNNKVPSSNLTGVNQHDLLQQSLLQVTSKHDNVFKSIHFQFHMRKIFILTSLIILLYLRKHFIVTPVWYLEYNPKNVLSEYLVEHFIKYFAQHYTICYILIISICFFSLFKNSMVITKFLGYAIALFIFTFGWQVILNVLCFEDKTEYAFLIVNHPIPVELKMHYFNMQLDSLFSINFPNTVTDAAERAYRRDYFTNLLSNEEIHRDIAPMNPEQISSYARKLFKTLL